MKERLGKEEKQKLLRMSEISLMLDDYDDIFSDFDPRPYSERSLSVDFLDEAKRASRDKDDIGIELSFLIPKYKRNTAEEALIKKRLHEHFRKNHHRLEKEKKEVVNKGILFTVMGIIVMFVASLILFKESGKNLLISFLIILLEPAGWFLFWEGLGQVIFEAKKKKPELEFYEKMLKCEIHFLPY